jgi:hypothetical protein
LHEKGLEGGELMEGPVSNMPKKSPTFTCSPLKNNNSNDCLVGSCFLPLPLEMKSPIQAGLGLNRAQNPSRFSNCRTKISSRAWCGTQSLPPRSSGDHWWGTPVRAHTPVLPKHPSSPSLRKEIDDAPLGLRKPLP